MMDLGTDVTPAASIPAHEIRRFESAIWSLYMLSDNPSVPAECRAACRIAADHAAGHMQPSDRAVPSLVNLVIEVGGADTPPTKGALLKRLGEIGWQGSPEALDIAPAPLDGPPARTLVSDKMRKQALDKILAECERHLKDADLLAPQKAEYAKRLDEIRSAKGDIRTKTEQAWALLEVLERNLYARTRETGAGA
jgi:hypothetical protein